jgi:hypothetical protein
MDNLKPLPTVAVLLFTKNHYICGAIGSLIGSGVSVLKLTGADAFVVSMWAGGLGGGISSKLAGGTFEDGFRNGLISVGLKLAYFIFKKSLIFAFIFVK